MPEDEKINKRIRLNWWLWWMVVPFPFFNLLLWPVALLWLLGMDLQASWEVFFSPQDLTRGMLEGQKAEWLHTNIMFGIWMTACTIVAVALWGLTIYVLARAMRKHIDAKNSGVVTGKIIAWHGFLLLLLPLLSVLAAFIGIAPSG